MNLYKISQTERRGYDTYDSAIVCAVNEQDAATLSPSGWDSTWCGDPSLVKVELIGVAIEGMDRGLVLASFNAW